MGALIRTHDWTESPLGPCATWPPSLRSAVSLMLGSRFPMFLVWGSELINLYNDSYITLLGARHPAALGSPLSSIWTEIWPELCPLVERAIAGEAIFFEDMPFTVERNGYPEQTWFTFSYSAIHDEDGAVRGMFCACAETSSRVRADRRHALVLKTMDRLRGLTNPDDMTEAASEMLGLHFDIPNTFYCEIDELRGTFRVQRDWARDDIRILSGQNGRLDDFGPEIISALRSGKAVAVSDVMTDARTGGHAPAYAGFGIRSILVLPLVKDGQLIASLNLYDTQAHHWSGEDLELAADVAERIWNNIVRARAEEALRQAGRRKDEFLAMLAHELRNPLAPIISAAELLNRVQLDPERMRKATAIIARQVRHMAGLIDELLDASRVTSGSVVLNREEVDVKRAVSDAVEQALPLIEMRRHHLTVAMAPESALAFADYKRLVQVLGNLINNAARFTAEGGNISVRLETGDEHVELWVEDDGVGMTQELVANIFEPFSQAERTSDRAQGGLGLGLTLVKSLLDLHGASIFAYSKGPNAGSQFHVRLPRLVCDTEQFLAVHARMPAISSVRHIGSAIN